MRNIDYIRSLNAVELALFLMCDVRIVENPNCGPIKKIMGVEMYDEKDCMKWLMTDGGDCSIGFFNETVTKTIQYLRTYYKTNGKTYIAIKTEKGKALRASSKEREHGQRKILVCGDIDAAKKDVLVRKIAFEYLKGYLPPSEQEDRERYADMLTKEIMAYIKNEKEEEKRRAQEKLCFLELGALTLDELRGMSGQPVYCPKEKLYGIISCDRAGKYEGIPYFNGIYGEGEDLTKFSWNIEAKDLKLYRVIREVRVHAGE